MSYQRFEALLRANKTTVYRVAKSTGISNSTFTDWKNGRSYPKADKLVAISRYFGVSVDSIVGENENRNEMTGYRSVAVRKMVPIIGEIRAGTPIITNETVLGYELTDIDNADDYFYLRICGDSMKNCGIIDKSLVLFRKQQYAEEREIVACLVGGERATVKRIVKRGRQIVLMPENESYEPIILTPEDFESGDARILGVAVEVKIKLEK